ncbi:hypothetical protein A2U01_0062462, partial [Trifolium medium]|nr:hypothetical protein [Trifolium medium]
MGSSSNVLDPTGDNSYSR